MWYLFLMTCASLTDCSWDKAELVGAFPTQVQCEAEAELRFEALKPGEVLTCAEQAKEDYEA